MELFHTPVLLEETLQYLAAKQEEALMIDATQGEGGHSAAFLERFPCLRIIGVDADRDIQDRAKKRLAAFNDRIGFYNCWAGDFFTAYPAELSLPDAILFDLGISLFHYNASGRGFSFMRDEYLDMRLDTSAGKTAADLITELSEKEFADLLYYNAGERYSRRISAAVQTAKKNKPITTTSALAELISASVPPAYRRGYLHPATRSFQALRMAVNGEEEKLPLMLKAALKKLKKGGRIGVISFHSGEDRTVKNIFREQSRDCTCPPDAPICRCEGVALLTILTRKPVKAGKEECHNNPPSRSAKFRAAEKTITGGADL